MDNLINDFRTSDAVDRFIFTYEYVTLHSENKFSDELRIHTLRWAHFSELSRGG